MATEKESDYKCLDDMDNGYLPYYIETWYENRRSPEDFQEHAIEIIAAMRVGQFFYNVAHMPVREEVM